jgi:hypothetical protein
MHHTVDQVIMYCTVDCERICSQAVGWKKRKKGLFV